MSFGVQYLDLADFLIIAGAVLDVDPEVLARQCDLHLADSALNAPRAGFGEVDFYPEFPTKAAVLCSHLIRNHPLMDGNKRVAYLCLVEFVERNGQTWSPPQDDPDGDETIEIIVGVADGTITAEALEGMASAPDCRTVTGTLYPSLSTTGTSLQRDPTFLPMRHAHMSPPRLRAPSPEARNDKSSTLRSSPSVTL